MSYEHVMKQKTTYLGYFLIFFHIVGVLGTSWQETRAIMLFLTPFNLIASAFLLSWFTDTSPGPLVKLFLLSFCIGMLVEIVGVSTGFPFGNYHYGETLGTKFLGVPIVIGVNWFMLSLMYGSMVHRLLPKANTGLKAGLAALAMVIQDILIEPIAIKLDYWTWETPSIPIQNFVSWFLVAFSIQLLWQSFIKPIQSSLDVYLIVSQILYFGMLLIFL